MIAVAVNAAAFRAFRVVAFNKILKVANTGEFFPGARDQRRRAMHP